MSEHYIKFENVKKSYGNGNAQINALDGVDFEINKGEFCILLGSSGAGKTTLLNMLGGMDTVTIRTWKLRVFPQPHPVTDGFM